MTEHIFRTRAMSYALAGLLLSGLGAASGARADPATVQVYKSPWCGCCEGWVEHLEAEGFAVEVEDLEDLGAVKRMAGVPEALESCHTAVVEGYTIEGHVPATAIERLLRELPEIDGLAAAGMPLGSPGMPSPTPERYHVMAFDGDETTVFESFVGTERQ